MDISFTLRIFALLMIFQLADSKCKFIGTYTLEETVLSPTMICVSISKVVKQKKICDTEKS